MMGKGKNKKIIGTREGEWIVIGNVKVRVLEVWGEFVRLGFAAPKDVLILRKELTIGWRKRRYADNQEAKSNKQPDGGPAGPGADGPAGGSGGAGQGGEAIGLWPVEDGQDEVGVQLPEAAPPDRDGGRDQERLHGEVGGDKT
jgi:carbon storage regulator CsrA